MDRRDDLIRDRAYQIWIAEGQPSDRHAEHWAQAEAEIDAELAAGAAAGTPNGELTAGAPLASSGDGVTAGGAGQLP